jgi:hypothetical protein
VCGLARDDSDLSRWFLLLAWWPIPLRHPSVGGGLLSSVPSFFFFRVSMKHNFVGSLVYWALVHEDLDDQVVIMYAMSRI